MKIGLLNPLEDDNKVVIEIEVSRDDIETILKGIGKDISRENIAKCLKIIKGAMEMAKDGLVMDPDGYMPRDMWED